MSFTDKAMWRIRAGMACLQLGKPRAYATLSARWESRQNAASCDSVFGGGMRVGALETAAAAAGFCSFLNLYSPQALLPALSREFGAGPAEISSIMTASALAIAVTAPFTGALADVLGRKRVIVTAMLAVVVPAAGAAFAPDVPALIAWRFLQGLLLPPIFAVTVAYIGDEWPPAEVAAVAGIYIAGSSLGGFCGRFIPGGLQ